MNKQTKYIVQCYFPTINETVNYYLTTLEPVKSFGYVIAIFTITKCHYKHNNRVR